MLLGKNAFWAHRILFSEVPQVASVKNLVPYCQFVIEFFQYMHVGNLGGGGGPPLNVPLSLPAPPPSPSVDLERLRYFLLIAYPPTFLF